LTGFYKNSQIFSVFRNQSQPQQLDALLTEVDGYQYILPQQNAKATAAWRCIPRGT
jgi:hypothetical protein